MRVTEFKIPTRHNEWTVKMCGWYEYENPVFVCNGYRMNRNEIPKTIWKRAKCFIADPDRYGRVRYF